MGDRGFTLAEVLVALLLLSLGLLAVAPMFVTAARQNAGSADSGVVGALAVERMERIRATPYDAVDAGGSLTSNASVSGVDYFDTSTTGYVVRWQVTGGATPDGGKTVAVRALALDAASGEPKEITLRTIRGGQ